MASPQAGEPPPRPSSLPAISWRKLPFAALAAAYFLYFCGDALSVHFGPDDVMNMGYYWRMKPVQILLSQFELWGDFYRPLAAFFYRPLYAWFGFNPAPYHAVILVLLAASVYLTYRLARLLGCGERSSLIAALLMAYHAGMATLYYDIAFVYDVLCWFFYLATTVYYLRIRHAGRLPNAREMAAFVGLYLCALNSKEMAVTLPVMLLAYELLYHPPGWNWGAWLRWPTGAGRAVVAGVVLNLIYIYGKVLRPGALITASGYRPQVSWPRFLEFQLRAWRDLFEAWNTLEMRHVAIIWAVLFLLTLLPRRPAIRFGFLLLLISPLPIEFLEGRGSASLAIPCTGLAIIAAVVIADVADLLARAAVRDPARRAFRQGVATALCVLAVWIWAAHNRQLKESYVRNSMAQLGQPTWDVIQQLRTLHARAAPKSTVVFLNDPFEGWDMLFIGQLWFNDHSVEVKVPRKDPMTPDEIARAAQVFDFREGKLVQVR